MFISISAKVPSVLVEDSTAAQANARARWNARRYGVTFSFLSNEDRYSLYCIEQDRVYAVANTPSEHADCLNACDDDGFCCSCGSCFSCTIGGCQACYWDVCPNASHDGSIADSFCQNPACDFESLPCTNCGAGL